MIIETDRLRLRRLTLDDVPNLRKIFSDPEAMRFYASTKNRQETVGWVHWNQKSYEKGGYGLWAVERKVSGEFVGQCGLVLQRDVEGRDEIEIGYSFVRTVWNQGFATEAATACRDYGLVHLGLPRLVSLIDPANLASARVAQKIGMRRTSEIWRWEKHLHVYSVSKRINDLPAF